MFRVPLRVSLCDSVTSPVLDSDCRALGGTASGSCASGFGICCAFTAGCGGRTSTNNTYFLSDGAVSPCSLTVCRANTNICQIRLDFDTFNIEGPVTATTTAGGG